VRYLLWYDLYFSSHMVGPINIERDFLIDDLCDAVLVAFGILFLVRVVLGLGFDFFSKLD
jgi:hypothetical protein